MANQADEISIELAILKIQDLGFTIDERATVAAQSKLDYNINVGYNVNEDWIEFTISPIMRNAETLQIFLSGSVLTRFLVKDIKTFVDGDRLNIPDTAMTTLFSMAFTHTRAILAKNCAGSRYSTIYLPIINPKEMLDQVMKNLIFNT